MWGCVPRRGERVALEAGVEEAEDFYRGGKKQGLFRGLEEVRFCLCQG